MLRIHSRLIAAVSGVVLFLSAPALAGFDEGMIAFKNNEFRKAIEEWEPLADAGHVMAQYNLGIIYLKGLGVARSYDVAMKHFAAAAGQGEPMAQFALGHMYSYGQGAPRDYVQAYKWISLAAAKGFAPADQRLKEIVPRMSEEQIEQAKKLADEFEASAKAIHASEPGKSE